MLERLTNRIYYMRGDAQTDSPYLYYVCGDKYSLAIDAGSSKAHVEAFYKAIEEKGFPKPDYTVLTHWHWDHTFGLYAVKGQTIASAKTNQKLRQVKTWKWTIEDMEAREKTGEDIAFCNVCIQKVYKDLSEIKVTTANIEVEEQMTIDLGGVTCQIEQHDSTHSRDSLFLYFPEERALAVGDADSEDHYENGGKYDKTRLSGILEYIEKFAFDHYLLGHDEPDTREGALSYLRAELDKLG